MHSPFYIKRKNVNEKKQGKSVACQPMQCTNIYLYITKFHNKFFLNINILYLNFIK